MMTRKFITIITAFMTLACNNDETSKAGAAAEEPANGTFAYDLKFLSSKDSGLVRLSDGSSAILVSPEYQAKVFTSTASGDSGKSFGWINYEAFDGPLDPHMNAYGGENRFWLGPEGSKYSIYFKPGDSMVFANWKTPPPIDSEPWEVTASSEKSVTMKKDMEIKNFLGTTYTLRAVRKVGIQDRAGIESTLSIQLPDSVSYVGYATENSITNTGTQGWNEQTGMPCIWILDMFNVSDSTTIVVPFKTPSGNDRVVNTDYFEPIGPDRLKLTDNALFFRADGKSRGKLGVAPKYAVPFAGSYDVENNVLTITYFDIDNSGRYLYEGWNTKGDVFSGDAMNAYNDGPLQDGSQMGPFYEIESVSPAAQLAPGQQLDHRHNVYHFTGNKAKLSEIAQKVLGVSLESIQQAFK